MNFLKKHLKQTATLWKTGTPDGTGGFTWTRSTLKVRWEDKVSNFQDEFGNEKQSRAVVYLSEDIDVGDYLFLGSSTESSPTGVTNAYEVQDFRKIPSLRANKFSRRAIL